MNAYRIAAELAIDVGLAVIVRTLKRIQELRAWLARIVQEMDGKILRGLKGMAFRLLGHIRWPGFTRRWFHALYPARIRAGGNPQNSALSP